MKLCLCFCSSFQNLGIQCVKRKEVKDAILQRINRGINPFGGEWPRLAPDFGGKCVPILLVSAENRPSINSLECSPIFGPSLFGKGLFSKALFSVEPLLSSVTTTRRRRPLVARRDASQTITSVRYVVFHYRLCQSLTVGLVAMAVMQHSSCSKTLPEPLLRGYTSSVHFLLPVLTSGVYGLVPHYVPNKQECCVVSMYIRDMCVWSLGGCASTPRFAAFLQSCR